MTKKYQKDHRRTGLVAATSERVAWHGSSRSGMSGNCVDAAAPGRVDWRKSSFSGSESNCLEAGVLEAATWSKSSHTVSQSNCVEVAGRLQNVVAVRDSKDPDGASLIFPAETWQQFTAALKLELPTA
jgi:hypothetical protein